MRIKDGCERAAAENVAACGCAVEPRQTNQDSRLAYKASIPAVDVPVRREAAERASERAASKLLSHRIHERFNCQHDRRTYTGPVELPRSTQVLFLDNACADDAAVEHLVETKRAGGVCHFL